MKQPKPTTASKSSQRYKCVLLFGAPGSGKGTQGKILGSIPGFFHTACGDIFRSLDLTSEMGQIFWKYSSEGQLVPDELTIQLWKQYIRGLEMINQFRPHSEILILDGIPRNVQQAKLLEDTLDVVKIIHLQCADLNKMVERLRRRALKENRFDDANDAVIRERLMVYDVETKPVLDFYPEDRVARLDATASQMRVLREIIDILVPLKEDLDNPPGGKDLKPETAATPAAVVAAR